MTKKALWLGRGFMVVAALWFLRLLGAGYQASLLPPGSGSEMGEAQLTLNILGIGILVIAGILVASSSPESRYAWQELREGSGRVHEPRLRHGTRATPDPVNNPRGAPDNGRFRRTPPV